MAKMVEDSRGRLIDIVEIKPGSRVLEIATGIGEPAIIVAKRVGNSGHVLAIDISLQMLSIAKQRANSLGLQDIIEFKERNAETMNLTSMFDAVVSIETVPDNDKMTISDGKRSIDIYTVNKSPILKVDNKFPNKFHEKYRYF